MPATKAKPLEGWQGPFAEYQIVTTPFGDYGIEAYKILDFEGKEVWNKKSGEWEVQAVPVYRYATEKELEAARIPKARNYVLPTAHPDKIEAPLKADKKLKDELRQRTQQLRTHHASRPGHVEE